MARPISEKHRKLLSAPPVRGATVTLAAVRKEYGVSNELVWKLIGDGRIRAWSGEMRCPAGRPGVMAPRECVRISAPDCRRVIRALGAKLKSRRPDPASPPADGEPIPKLARELGVSTNTVNHWCDWKWHPALGRKIRSGFGPYEVAVRGQGSPRRLRGRLASRADLAACVAAMKSPLHRQFPGNPGVWIARDLFRHESGCLYYTRRHVEGNRTAFDVGIWTLARLPRDHPGRLQVIYPAEGGWMGQWRRIVYAESLLSCLADRRKGREGAGYWLDDGDTWKDEGGVWYSSKFLAKKTGVAPNNVSKAFRSSGRIKRFKNVPPPAAPAGASRLARSGVWTVHHAADVHLLLGIGGGASTGGAATAAGTGPAVKGKAGRKPDPAVEEVLRYCYERWSAGHKLASIRSGATSLYGVRAPKEDSHVFLYAKRYAERKELPLVRG